MKTTVIGREELIDMFESINDQLEQLETSIMINVSKQQNEWQRKQAMQIDSCGKQLESLESKMSSIKERNDPNNTTTLRLKLSY
ncbi:hypothetical protein JMM81_02850 [Bacillus sp. V3B]|uniref:hypothetical protein n=1 Tax=Bacillus sp. V3B TaxID=2804915 RepID=UPI00210BB884|nr:hypothetical protein [Bacillus sp. V3B]MCQ6273917.1 hypothetical protein [Bacillus sp. V3B]